MVANVNKSFEVMNYSCASIGGRVCSAEEFTILCCTYPPIVIRHWYAGQVSATPVHEARSSSSRYIRVGQVETWASRAGGGGGRRVPRSRKIKEL